MLSFYYDALGFFIGGYLSLAFRLFWEFKNELNLALVLLVSSLARSFLNFAIHVSSCISRTFK